MGNGGARFSAAAQAGLAGADDHLGAVGGVELGEDVGDVVAHGLWAEVEETRIPGLV